MDHFAINFPGPGFKQLNFKHLFDWYVPLSFGTFFSVYLTKKNNRTVIFPFFLGVRVTPSDNLLVFLFASCTILIVFSEEKHHSLGFPYNPVYLKPLTSTKKIENKCKRHLIPLKKLIWNIWTHLLYKYTVTEIWVRNAILER